MNKKETYFLGYPYFKIYNYKKEPQQRIYAIKLLFHFCNTQAHCNTYDHSTYTQIAIKKIYFFSLQYIRMSVKNINFEDKKIKKGDFYKNKKVTKIDDIDVNKILVSKKKIICYKKFI